MKAYIFPLIVLSIVGCSQPTTKTATTEAAVEETTLITLSQEQFSNAQLKLGNPAIQALPELVNCSGVVTVLPQQQSSISFPIGGYVERVAVNPGQFVQQGTVLCTIQDVAIVQLQQDYLVAKSQLKSVQSEYERQQKLNSTAASSDRTTELAKAEFDRVKIELRSLQEKLQLIGIDPSALNENSISRSVALKAPISGNVTKMNVFQGQYVNPSDALFHVMAGTSSSIVLTVFEKDVYRFKAGDLVSFTTAQDPTLVHQAVVTVVNPAIGAGGNAEVYCTVDGVKVNLIPGTLVTAQIATTNATAMVIPAEAVVRWENKSYVFLQKDGLTFEMIPIETGIEQDALIEIKNHVDWVNQKVVVKNAFTVLMMMKNVE